MKKQCSVCGRELPEDASFCPYCTTQQIEKQQVTAPQARKGRRLLPLAVVCLALGLIAGILTARHQRAQTALSDQTPESAQEEAAAVTSAAEPEVEAAAETTADTVPAAESEEQDPLTLPARVECTIDGRELLLWVGESQRPPEWDAQVFPLEYEAPLDMTVQNPSLLMVRDQETGENLGRSFEDYVSDWQVTTLALDEAPAVTCTEPHRDTNFYDAAAVSDVVYSTENSLSLVCWTIQLTDGQCIRMAYQVRILSPEEDAPAE